MEHNGKPIEVRYQEFPQELRGVVKGLATAKFESKYIILIDSTQHAQTQRYTLGHELAHICLNHFESKKPIADLEREASERAWEYYRLYSSSIQVNK